MTELERTGNEVSVTIEICLYLPDDYYVYYLLLSFQHMTRIKTVW